MGESFSKIKANGQKEVKQRKHFASISELGLALVQSGSVQFCFLATLFMYSCDRHSADFSVLCEDVGGSCNMCPSK